MRTIKFKEVIKMKDLQAPHITDAEIYGVDSGQSADVPLDECCAYCGEPMYRGQTVTVLREYNLTFCDGECLRDYFADISEREIL